MKQRISVLQTSNTRSWAVPIAAIICALLAQRLLIPLVGNRPFLLLYPALWIAAFYGNRVSTAMAGVLGGIAAGIWFSDHSNFSQIIFGTIIFTSCGLILASLIDVVSKKTEEQIRTFEHQLAMGRISEILSSIGDAYIEVAPNWILTNLNSNFESLVQEPMKNMIGQDIRKLWFNNEKRQSSTAWIEYSGVMNLKRASEFTDFYEHLNVWVRIRAFPKPSGGFDAYFTNISSEKNAEAKLIKSKSDLGDALSNGQMGAWAIDFSNGHLTADEKFRELHNMSSTDDLAYVVKKITHPEDAPFVQKGLELTMLTGVPFDCEYRILNNDGSYRWTRARGKPLFDSNGVVRSITGIAFNTDDRKIIELQLADTALQVKQALAEANRANVMKTAFLANMSHEIRTPLGAIIGFADLLKDPGLTAGEHANYLNIISRNGHHLAHLINDILDLSKVEAGHLQLEYIQSDHRRIGAEVVSLLQVNARDKDLSLEYSSDESTPDTIISDPTRIRQILLNLVSNAIKFTQFGSVKIRTYGCHTDDGHPSLCFEVSDTGMGMTQEQQDRLFQPFSQADETTTRKFGGTGLGLALSRRLARELGGDITIEKSEINLGSTFLVKIAHRPEMISESVAVSMSESKTIDAPKGRTLEGVNILVVDDAPDNQQLIWRYLTKQGAIVEAAENGLVGYRAALNGSFDIILMDIQMPIMDGYTATQKLRDAGYVMPIIALTAHAMNDIRKKALNVGYNDHLTKPINPGELIATIRRFTERVS